jgi:tetratricopeptide (TPR) repeat protein
MKKSMNKYIEYICIGFIIMEFLFTCFSSLYAGDPGSKGALFLNYSPGGRGSAMADAFTSVADDAYASYFNPAGLVEVENIQFGATYNSSFENINHQYIVIACPYKPGNVFSLNYSGLSYGNIESYDAVGTPGANNVEASDKSMGFSYGRTFTKDEIERPVLSAGATLKYIGEKLAGISANTFAFDLGAVYALRPDKYWLSEIPGQEFQFSIVAKNIGPGIKFDKEAAPLPMSFVFGSSWHLHPWGVHKLILSLDNIILTDDKYKIAFGAEYFLFQLLGVRVGYETNKYIGSNFSFGVGFKLSFVDIDYSMTPFGELGNMQKISLLARFGYTKEKQPLKGEVIRVKEAKLVASKEKIKELQMFASDFLELAEKNINAGDWILAGENLNKAFNLQPELRKDKWGRIEKTLAELNMEMKFEKMPEKMQILKSDKEQSNLAREAIKNFIYSENDKAYLLAHIAYGTNIKGNAVYEELLNIVANLLKRNIRRDETLPKKAWMNQKLKRSSNYFYIRQYDIVVRELEEIILIDDTQYIVWARLGSAYYMLGDREKARKSYLKAIEINPNDKATLQFLKSKGWLEDSNK